MKHSIFCSLIMAGIAVSSANAKTITVSKTTPADFTEIQAAINSFGGVKDVDGTPNIINILDNSAYEEVITVDAFCSIIGNASNRPRILVKINDANHSIGSTGGIAAYDGICIAVKNSVEEGAATTGTTALKNLIIMPSMQGDAPNDAIISFNLNGFIHYDNLLITANNGSDQPLSTDGLTEVPLGSGRAFTGNGIYAGYSPTADYINTTTGLETLFTKNVVTHLGSTGNTNAGFYFSGVAPLRKHTVGAGNISSFNAKLGIVGSALLKIDSKSVPTLIMGNKGFAGLWYGVAAGVARTIDGIHVVNNVGTGIEQNSGGNFDFSLKNSILTGNAKNLQINTTTTNGNSVIENVTLANPKAGNPTFQVLSGSNSNITIKNSIIAGNGSADVNNVIDHNGGGTLTLEGTAIVAAGPFALNSATNAGTGSVSGVASTTADPSFVQTANPKLTGFFDVASGQYSNVNATGGPLGGGAKYVGPSSSVSDWNLF